jgi:hypothetical protein
MRKSKLFVLTFGLVSMTFYAQAQGSLQNLDFEAATVSPVPPDQFGSLVPIVNAFPGWTGYVGTNQMTDVLQNNFTLGTAWIDIIGPDWPYSGIIEGQYTALLQAGFNGAAGSGYVNVSLSQIGLVPSNAQSIQLEVSGVNFSVSFAGQNISLIPIGSGPNYTLYAGDISSFAGQNGDLVLTAMTTPDQLYNNVYFDSIAFSPSAVPEPSTLALLAIGGTTLLFRRKLLPRPF